MSQIKETSTNALNKENLGATCSEIYALSLINGRWTLSICCILGDSKMRFNELKSRIPNITDRMLSLHLKEMEKNKLLIRTLYPGVPPKVEYELTESAKALRPILKQLEAWGETHKNFAEE